jgi:hypothetical protein
MAGQASTRPEEERHDTPYAPVSSLMISHAMGLWSLPWSFVRHLFFLEAQMGKAVRTCALRDLDDGGRAVSSFPLRVRSPRRCQATTPSLPSTESESAQKRLQTSARSQRLAVPWPSVAHGKAALKDAFALTNICVSEYMSRKKGDGQRGQQPPERRSLEIFFESLPISGTA